MFNTKAEKTMPLKITYDLILFKGPLQNTGSLAITIDIPDHVASKARPTIAKAFEHLGAAASIPFQGESYEVSGTFRSPLVLPSGSVAVAGRSNWFTSPALAYPLSTILAGRPADKLYFLQYVEATLTFAKDEIGGTLAIEGDDAQEIWSFFGIPALT